MSWAAWIGCGMLGSLGALARATTSGAMTRRFGIRFPWGTLAVNLIGALLLGLLHGAGVGGREMVLLGGAFLGSMTTFSTWMLETVRLAAIRPWLASANIACQLAGGLAMAALGNTIAQLA